MHINFMPFHEYSILTLIIACRLFGAKPLSKPMLCYWQLDPCMGTKLGETLIKIQNFSVMKMHMKLSSAKWMPFCLGGDELIPICTDPCLPFSAVPWQCPPSAHGRVLLNSSSSSGNHNYCQVDLEMQHHFDGLVQGCSISSALAMEILQSFTKSSICS